ncbi:MAG: hypothetical protein V1926_06085 [Candidatus Peregrinibacteria bacterium]
MRMKIGFLFLVTVCGVLSTSKVFRVWIQEHVFTPGAIFVSQSSSSSASSSFASSVSSFSFLSSVFIIDDTVGPDAFKTQGVGWLTGRDNTVGGYRGSSFLHLFTFGRNIATSARWRFRALPEGTYDVFVTWVPTVGASRNVSYGIQGGSSPAVSATIDQNTAPHGMLYDGVMWQQIGSLRLSGMLTVSASAPNTEKYSADAVLLMRRSSSLSSSSSSFSSA